MYPNLYYLFKDIFGIELEFLKAIQSFGFFVAIAFIAAAWFFSRELKRKEEQGLLHPVKEKIRKGEKASTADYLGAGIIGFIIGYKLLFIALNFSAFTEDTQGFILSADGNFIGGIIGAALSVWMKHRDKEKERAEYPEPKTIEETVHPYQMVGNMTLIAAVAGLLGAKIFHNLENLDEFMRDPVEALLSFSGLTMYGGLILGGAAVIWYARKKNISIPHLIDASAPALMLAYGIGRIGCQVAGDGDWGIPNSAYITQADGSLVTASMVEFQQAVQAHSQYFISNFGSLDKVPHLYAPAPDFLPDWMYAMNYPNNVNNAGMPIPGCTGPYCSVLPTGVFPTPLYESAMSIGLFLVLWGLRKKIVIPGVLFSFYLVLNGLERYLIEQIRVNEVMFTIGGKPITQAMIIALALVLLGVIGVIYFRKRYRNKKSTGTTAG